MVAKFIHYHENKLSLIEYEKVGFPEFCTLHTKLDRQQEETLDRDAETLSRKHVEISRSRSKESLG